MSTQFSSSTFPQTAPGFRGIAQINAFPAGPKDSYLTVGGFLDSSDSNNDSIDILTFGTVVTSLATATSKFVVGKPSASYFYRGVTISDSSILENEPFKSNGILKGSPATVMFDGLLRLSAWTATHTSALTAPVLGCKVVAKDSTGAIEFIGSATSVDAGWTDISAYAKVVSYESGVGVMLKLAFY